MSTCFPSVAQIEWLNSESIYETVDKEVLLGWRVWNCNAYCCEYSWLLLVHSDAEVKCMLRLCCKGMSEWLYLCFLHCHCDIVLCLENVSCISLTQVELYAGLLPKFASAIFSCIICCLYVLMNWKMEIP